MTRDQIVSTVRGALINLRFPLYEITQPKIATILEDRIPESQVVFDEDTKYYVTGSVVVEGVKPVQFRVAKDTV